MEGRGAGTSSGRAVCQCYAPTPHSTLVNFHRIKDVRGRREWTRKTGTHREGDGRRKNELLATAAAHDDPDSVSDQGSAAKRGHNKAEDLDTVVRVVDLVVHVLGDRDGEDEEVEGDHGAVWTGSRK